jgi:hypothetical protein
VSIGLTRDARHFYSWNGDAKVPGITTCIGMLDKPALVGWAKRETAVAALRNFDAVRAMVAQYPVGEDLTGHPVVSFLKGTPGYQKDTAAAIGTLVHAAAEEIAHGKEPTLDNTTRPYVEAYVRDFWDRYQPKTHPMYIEFMVFHTGSDGVVLPYGGTMDLACEIAGEWWLLDIKTSRSGAYAETGLQLAAGRYAEFMGRPGDSKQYTVPQATRYGVVWVRPEGAELIEYRVTPQEFEAFAACRRMWEWVNKRSKEVKAA